MTDWIDGLERLKSLKEQGHLSDSEFELAKGRLLEGDTVKPNQSATPAIEVFSDELISEVSVPFSPPPRQAAPALAKAPRQLGIIPKAVLAVVGLVLLGGGGFVLTWYLAGGVKASTEIAEVADAKSDPEKHDDIAPDAVSKNVAAPQPQAVSEPEDAILQTGLKAIADAPCPRLIAMGGSNSCTSQMMRNYKRGSDDERRSARMVAEIEKSLAARCSPSDSDWYYRYSLDLKTRALKVLGDKAHTASTANDIAEMAIQTCTDLAFDDLLES